RDVFRTDGVLRTCESCSAARQVEDLRLLGLLGRPDADAYDVDAGVGSRHARDYASVRTPAAAAEHQMIDDEVLVERLLHQLLSTGDVTQRSQWVGASAWDHVRNATCFPHFVGFCLHGCDQIGA